MSKTWYGHHIETLKGEDYVLHKDYIELQNKLEKENERLNNIINKAIEYVNNGTMISNIENLDFRFNSKFKPEELLNILKGE